LLYWLFIDEVVLLLFSARYVEAGGYARLLLFMVLISVPATFLGTFTIARKKTRSVVLGYHIYPVLKLAIMAGFIYQWGIWGAVWGLNVSMLLQMLLIWAGIVSEEGPL
jgi:O-antigen/teichoic acid export membrane protein